MEEYRHRLYTPHKEDLIRADTGTIDNAWCTGEQLLARQAMTCSRYMCGQQP